MNIFTLYGSDRLNFSRNIIHPTIRYDLPENAIFIVSPVCLSQDRKPFSLLRSVEYKRVNPSSGWVFSLGRTWLVKRHRRTETRTWFMTVTDYLKNFGIALIFLNVPIWGEELFESNWGLTNTGGGAINSGNGTGKTLIEHVGDNNLSFLMMKNNTKDRVQKRWRNLKNVPSVYKKLERIFIDIDTAFLA